MLFRGWPRAIEQRVCEVVPGAYRAAVVSCAYVGTERVRVDSANGVSFVWWRHRSATRVEDEWKAGECQTVRVAAGRRTNGRNIDRSI